jgi:hypothetical protein
LPPHICRSDQTGASIRSGIKILYTDMLHSLKHAKETVRATPDLWHPIEDWKVD